MRLVSIVPFLSMFFWLKRCYENECLGFGLGLCPRSLYLSVVANIDNTISTLFVNISSLVKIPVRNYLITILRKKFHEEDHAYLTHF